MTQPTTVVALEGPSCAGKTTLSQGLQHALPDLLVALVRCYADHVGGGRFLPPAMPTTLDEDRAGLRELIRIERDRTRPALTPSARLILMDRSVHTLLAHRYAIEQLTGLECYLPAQRILAESGLTSWPDLVLYLDVPPEVVRARNNGKFPCGSIFLNAEFNAAFRTYFAQLTQRRRPRVSWLEATLDPAKLVSMAMAQMGELSGGRHGKEGPAA